MLRSVIALAVVSLGLIGFNAISRGNSESPPNNPATITLVPVQTPNGPEIQINVGDLVLVAKELQLRRDGWDGTMRNVDGKLRLAGHKGTSTTTQIMKELKLPATTTK